ncbi:pilus assembly protein [Methylobacterium sp. E-005]|uniref:TadE/TadG family type IV pilus assembly protein n=1 Tax=Methylobacterium sp. E-005 TaxID=2836549 RepID=UPI001FBAF027|nr:TadE/TadG family type IV pilus assembly protein [Methylobacterium sp. E-005]MCJ2085265.1 pilus assembly protein [Methylobacterium sp. E-005]
MSAIRLLRADPSRPFLRDCEGVAALEFALILPILLMFLAATAEFVSAVDQKRKVAQLGRTLADLTAQGDTQNPVSSTLMSDIVASSGPILAPFPSTAATIQISAVGVYQANNPSTAYVCSVYPTTGKRSVGSATDIAVPKNFQRIGARFVLVEVTMPFKPILGAMTPKIVRGLNLNFTWAEKVTWPVRSGSTYLGDSEIVLPNGRQCP